MEVIPLAHGVSKQMFFFVGKSIEFNMDEYPALCPSSHLHRKRRTTLRVVENVSGESVFNFSKFEKKDVYVHVYNTRERPLFNNQY